MAKEPIKIVKTDGTVDKDKAKEIARDIMKDINDTRAKNADQSNTQDK